MCAFVMTAMAGCGLMLTLKSATFWKATRLTPRDCQLLSGSGDWRAGEAVFSLRLHPSSGSLQIPFQLAAIEAAMQLHATATQRNICTATK